MAADTSFLLWIFTMPNQMGALIIYGRGAELGNFKFFADDLYTTELARFGTNIQARNIERREDFFQLLLNPPIIIRELHILSHSIGGGLFLGYGDDALNSERSHIAASKRGGKANYYSVLNTEKGAVFTDDLIRPPYANYRAAIQKRFTADAKIKIWGCNSGWVGWRYSDEDTSGNRVYDIDSDAKYYYWRALNQLHSPKPSIAQEFANYFQRTTYGAGSGASIQVKYQEKWIWVNDFLKATKRRFVKETDILRLAPDKGDYNEYEPQ